MIINDHIASLSVSVDYLKKLEGKINAATLKDLERINLCHHLLVLVLSEMHIDLLSSVGRDSRCLAACSLCSL